MSVRTASGFMTRLNLTRIHPRSRPKFYCNAIPKSEGTTRPPRPPPPKTPSPSKLTHVLALLLHLVISSLSLLCSS